MPDPGIGLDEECFLDHIAALPFIDGLKRGKWDLVQQEEIKWPNSVIWIEAAERTKSPNSYHFFFTLDGYPKSAPTSHLWDPETQTKLDLAKWPKGEGNVRMVFRTDWENGKALYAPWDRLAIVGHGDWVNQFPGIIWNYNHTIVHYLSMVHQLLNCEQYRGS